MRIGRCISMGAAALVAIAVVGCGGSSGGTTTIVKQPSKPQTVTVEQAAPKTVTEKPKPRPKPKPAPAPTTTQTQTTASNPPNVKGLALPDAESMLKSAGFKPSVSNTDTTFGIIIKADFKVCKEGAPRGNVVPILAQKYGC